MRQVVGDHSVDEVLTIGREAIALQAKEELQRLCDLYDIGIEVQQLVLQDVNPPDPVKPAFNEVNQAIQEKERAINDAWADYNKAVPQGQGRGRAGGARGRGLRARARQQRRGRRQALRGALRGVPQGAGGDAQAHLPRDAWRSCCPSSERKVILDEKARGILPLSPARRRGAGGEAVKRPLAVARRRGRWLAAAALVRLHGVRDRAGDPHPVRPPGGRPRHRARACTSRCRSSRPCTASTSAGWSSTATPTRSPPRTRSTSGSTPTRAGASPTRCASSRPCATSAARRAASTTSSTARRATRSPPST